MPVGVRLATETIRWAFIQMCCLIIFKGMFIPLFLVDILFSCICIKLIITDSVKVKLVTSGGMEILL